MTKTRDQAGLDRRARLVIAACVVLPVLIGVVVTAGTFRADPAPPPALVGHWVYVPSLSSAVHVDGGSKKVDATVHVGAASPGSTIVQSRQDNYVVDYDRMIVFTKSDGVTGDKPSPGVAEDPVAVQAAGNAYLVYRTTGMILPLGGQQITVGGRLGMPVITPRGQLWVNRLDTGDICVLDKQLTCDRKIPHQGTLTVVDGNPVFIDTTASTWQPLTGTTRPTKLGVHLPDNAAIGSSAVDGRVPVIDPATNRLLLIAATGESKSIPLPPGDYERPYASGAAVEVVQKKTGAITTFDSQGTERRTMLLGSEVRMTQGDDGRVYTDTTDGLQSIVMDADGVLTPVPTSDQIPPTYHAPAPTTSSSVPPANVAVTTTETIPAAPDTVTVEAPPTSTGAGNDGTGGDGAGTGEDSKKPKKPTSTEPLPGAPPGTPTVDVLGATALGGGKARVHISVHGNGPVFCHLFFNSVERGATTCKGVMDVTATGIPAHQLYDIYVLGVNEKGTGNPGRRGTLAM